MIINYLHLIYSYIIIYSMFNVYICISKYNVFNNIDLNKHNKV